MKSGAAEAREFSVTPIMDRRGGQPNYKFHRSPHKAKMSHRGDYLKIFVIAVARCIGYPKQPLRSDHGAQGRPKVFLKSLTARGLTFNVGQLFGEPRQNPMGTTGKISAWRDTGVTSLQHIFVYNFLADAKGEQVGVNPCSNRDAKKMFN
jgi:hypothetical protein